MHPKYRIFFRACDKVESVHKVKRPYSLKKIEIIKTCFFSMYQSVQSYDHSFVIIGDDLSSDLLNFFGKFENVTVQNYKFRSASKSLKKQIELALEVSDEEWVYMCEDDYLHSPNAFKFLSEFINNIEVYTETSGKKKNFMNRIIGDLSNLPVVIHPPDYPDRYRAPWKRLSFIFLSKYCHWRQITNTTHTVLLKSSTLKHFQKFFRQSAEGPSDSVLSEKVYGRIFFKNKALCISPIYGLSTHMTENVMTPLVDWEHICQENISQMKSMGVWFD